MNNTSETTSAAQNGEHEEVDLFKLFPEMKPVEKAPTMFSINGFGLSMAGRRDGHAKTRSYIKNHVITLLFIPVIAIGAYRVTDAQDGGWYFLGKEKMSRLSAIWNLVVVAAIAGMIGISMWQSKINSPDYKASQKIAEAEEHLNASAPLLAAKSYLEAYHFNSAKNKDKAVSGFKQAIDEGLKSNHPTEAAGCTELLIDSPLWPKLRADYNSLYSDTLDRAKNASAEDPDTALQFIDSASQIAGSDIQWVPIRTQLLETKLQNKENFDVSLAEELSQIYLDNSDIQKVIELLEPNTDKISGSEAERILGTAYLNTGVSDKAVHLLESYVSTRQKRWETASNKLDQLGQSTYQKAIDALDNGKAPEKFYTDYNKANEEEQYRMVDEYVANYVEKDRAYNTALQSYNKLTSVPAAVMDLGVAYLGIAQTDANHRQENLEKAEKTLLSLQSYAGDSQEYKLFLGQVYYWLGKSDEGKKLFDSLIADSERSFNILYLLAQTLREIGIVDESKNLLEEAFEKGSTLEDKSAAAELRSLLSDDSDEQITWLKKCDQMNPDVKIRLNTATARLAWEKNDKERALKHYQLALAGYQDLPVNEVTLNNMALLHFQLFNVTGDVSHYNDGLAKMEKAIEVEPNNSILSGNTADAFFTAAYHEVLSSELEPRILQYGIDVSYFRFFYENHEEREKIMSTLRNHPHYKKAKSLFERALLLSPQSRDLYAKGLTTFSITRDMEMLSFIERKIEESKIDLSGDESKWLQDLNSRDLEEEKRSQTTYREFNNQVKSDLKKPIWQAVIESHIQSSPFSLWDVSPILDIEKRIQKLEELKNKFPSSAMSSTYNSALMTMAAVDLRKGEPEFSSWVEKAKSQLGAEALVGLWLENATSPEEVFSKYPSVKKAIVKKIELSNQFSNSYDAGDWYFSRFLSLDESKRIRKLIDKDPITKTTGRFYNDFAPYSPGSILSRTIQLMAEGKEDEGKEFYRESRKKKQFLPEIY